MTAVLPKDLVTYPHRHPVKREIARGAARNIDDAHAEVRIVQRRGWP